MTDRILMADPGAGYRACAAEYDAAVRRVLASGHYVLGPEVEGFEREREPPRLEGTVRLRVYVGEDGAVRDVKVLSGDRTLADAAVQAVRQWRYEPMLVDDKPVSVITNVTVEFRLR